MNPTSATTDARRVRVVRRVPLRVLLVSAALSTGAAVAGLPAHATYEARTTADEPQYLLTARSLVDDGDLDISDELDAQRWRDYHAAPLPQQTRPLPGGVRISPHDPLLAVLLAPGVAAAGWVGAKLTLAMLGGVLAAVLAWTAIVRFDVRPAVAVAVTAVFTASVPLAPYGGQVYPELPAALVVAAAVAALLGRPRAAMAAVVGVVCCALPWLGIKYAPVAAVLAAAVVTRMVRAGLRRPAITLVAGLLVVGAGYLVVHQHVWSGATAYASADHFVDTGELSVIGVAPDYWARSTRLVGLLVDRTFGIAAWQPAWLPAVVAAGAAVRARREGWHVLVALLASGWLTAAYIALTMAGWWVPGRQIVVVLPAAVLLCAWWADRSFVAAVAVLLPGLAGVATWLLLAWEASVGHLTLVIDFFDTANPLYGAWRLLLPDYLAPSAATWWRHALWLLALAGLAGIGWRSAGPPGARTPDGADAGRVTVPR